MFKQNKFVENSNFNEIKQKHKLTLKSMEKMNSDEYLCPMTVYIIGVGHQKIKNSSN